VAEAVYRVLLTELCPSARSDSATLPGAGLRVLQNTLGRPCGLEKPQNAGLITSTWGQSPTP
jgi:hypothetical protein